MVDVIITDACYYEDLLVLKTNPDVERRRRRALVFFMNEFMYNKEGKDPSAEDIAKFLSVNEIVIFPDTRIFFSHNELRMPEVTKLYKAILKEGLTAKHPPRLFKN